MEPELLPEVIVNPEQVNDYQYVCKDGSLASEQQIYLDCIYDEETYYQECRCIEALKNVIYDETCFLYPACILCLGDYSTSQYVLLNEEQHQIVYIYLQLAALDDIVFPKEYLPYGYREYGEKMRLSSPG